MTTPPELRRAAYDREQGRCFVTGRPLGDPDTGPWELHHRMPGGMGGTSRDRDTLPNVIAVLGTVHNLGGGGARSIHGDPGWSMPSGWLLSPNSPIPPLSRPALHWQAGWVFLLADGSYEPVR